MSLKRIIQQLFLTPFRNGKLFSSLWRLPKYLNEFHKLNTISEKKIEFRFVNPQLFDATEQTEFDAHYFYQSAWCARKIVSRKTTYHVDIASQINLIAPLSAFVKVEFIDFRPLHVNIDNLISRAGTILDLPFENKSVKSLSCLHVIEHIGLGRYGDTLDPMGSEKACKELQRILALDGDLYLTTPVGKERIEFNAHRVHAPATILQFFNELTLVDFSCVDDKGNYVENTSPGQCADYLYGLGLFHFRRTGR